MNEMIEEVMDRWGEYIEMYPPEQHWQVIAQLLAQELYTERYNTQHFRRLYAITRPTKQP